MLIPIRDENPTSRTAWLTIALIAANVAVFLLWQPTFETGRRGQVEQIAFFYCQGEIPWEVTNQTSLARGGDEALQAIAREDPLGPRVEPEALQEFLMARCPEKNWLASIFVAMFVHGGWLHIVGNMLYLWIFGNNVEDKIGPLGFVLFYTVGGVAATFAQIATSPDSVVPTIGASGAVAAVLGAYLVMFPRHRVLSILPIFFFWQFIELPALAVLGFWFVLQVFNGFGALVEGVNAGVAYWAHIGGFVVGVVAALLLFPKERRRRIEHPFLDG